MRRQYFDIGSIRAIFDKFPNKSFGREDYTSAWTVALVFMNIKDSNYNENRELYKKIQNSSIHIDWDLPNDKVAKAYDIEFKTRNELLKDSYFEIIETNEFGNLSKKTINELNIFSKALYDFIANYKNMEIKKETIEQTRFAMTMLMLRKTGPENTIKVMSSYNHSLDRYIYAINYFYNDNNRNNIIDENGIYNFAYLDDETTYITTDNYFIKLDNKYKKTINVNKYLEKINI
jgi:hypothetical protein